jgi:hypothetical protein
MVKQLNNLTHAKQCPVPCIALNKKYTLAQANGIRFEKKVFNSLSRFFNHIEHNPWFEYRNNSEFAYCSPDILIKFDNILLIIEVKLTWVKEAQEKLDLFYRPIITKANPDFDPDFVKTLVIVKNLTPESPEDSSIWSKALDLDKPLLFWSDEVINNYGIRGM